MKNVLSILLVSVFILSVAFAEGLDFSNMTDEELVAVYQNAANEIKNRGLVVGEERTLREGKYIIGKDIAAGTYTITCIGTEGESFGESYGSLGSMMDVFDDDSDTNWSDLYGSLGSMVGDYLDMSVKILGDYGDVLREYNMKNGDSFSLSLEEDTALEISNGSCTIKAE